MAMTYRREGDGGRAVAKAGGVLALKKRGAVGAKRLAVKVA